MLLLRKSNAVSIWRAASFNPNQIFVGASRMHLLRKSTLKFGASVSHPNQYKQRDCQTLRVCQPLL